MLLRDQLEQALDGLATDETGATATRAITLNADHCQIVCQITAVGTLGCAADYISLTPDSSVGKSIEQLQAVADDLARNLSYLLEPVATIETDSEHQVVQMRSDPPHRESEQLSYYELLVMAGGALQLRRYRKAGGQSRQPIPAQFTREVLGRLIHDLAAAVTK